MMTMVIHLVLMEAMTMMSRLTLMLAQRRRRRRRPHAKTRRKPKAMFFWHCIVPAGRIVIMHCSTCTCTMYICGLNSKKYKVCLFGHYHFQGKSQKSKKKGSKDKKPKGRTGKGKSRKNKGKDQEKDPEAEKAKEAAKLFGLKTPRRSGCTLYPEHNPLVSLCKAIGDINTRVRQANEKIKTMTAWHLVKNKWGT